MEHRTVVLAVCVALGSAASLEDLWRRSISNLTILTGLAAGLGLQVWGHGWARGALHWAAGAAVGLAMFLIFFLLGGMGGGDVKLMAAFGACLGPGQIFRAGLLAAVVGALLACAYLAAHWLRRRLRGPSGRPAGDTIPYAPAIFAGILLSFLG